MTINFPIFETHTFLKPVLAAATVALTTYDEESEEEQLPDQDDIADYLTRLKQCVASAAQLDNQLAEYVIANPGMGGLFFASLIRNGGDLAEDPVIVATFLTRMFVNPKTAGQTALELRQAALMGA